MEILLSDATRSTAGVLLVTIVLVESGGLFLLRVVRRSHPATAIQAAFYRAGHAHAGVLVTLALASQLYVDVAALEGLLGTLSRSGIAGAAILMPAGFFLSVIGRDVTRPNPLVGLVYLGALSLAGGALALGLGLLIG